MDLDAIEQRANAYRTSHAHPFAFACCTAHGSADDVPALVARVRELEEENQQLRDSIASQIFADEQKCQEAIDKDPTSEHLNGRLAGLQRARDIVNP